MKMKKPLFQGHTLGIDNFFYQKINYSLRLWSAKRKLIFNVSTIFNNYFKKSFSAGAHLKNKNAQLEHLPNKVFWFLLCAPPVQQKLYHTPLKKVN